MVDKEDLLGLFSEFVEFAKCVMAGGIPWLWLVGVGWRSPKPGSRDLIASLKATPEAQYKILRYSTANFRFSIPLTVTVR